MTMAQLGPRAAQAHGSRPAMRYLEDGQWRQRTYTEVWQDAEQLANGLIALGIQPGDRVCVFANTSPEWTLVNLAVWAVGAIVVSVYPSNSPEECEWVVGNSEAVAIVCGDAEHVDKVEQVRAVLPRLRHVLAVDSGTTDATSLDQLRELGRDVDAAELSRRFGSVEPEDAATFIYTSGTTGKPKGCVLTHHNNNSVAECVVRIGLIGPDDTIYLFLPLAHIFAQIVQNGALQAGAEIIYAGGDSAQILPELAVTQPTLLPSVPRIYEKIYTKALARLEGLDAAQRAQFEQAVELGLRVRRLRERGEQVPEPVQQAFEKADTAIFANVRALFGGQVRKAVSGAAPIAPDALRFFYACGVTVLEGFGMTETNGFGAVNLPGAMKIGSVGRLTDVAKARIAQDGEIEFGGDVVFREYWRNPEATAETFTADGWLRTGDLGSIDDDGYLSITGRKKDIIITAGGKNLTPANLENDLRQSRWVSQAVMYGDRRPYPVAVITLDAEEIVPWAESHGLPSDLASLAHHDEVRKLVAVDLEQANTRYAQVEQIKRFVILDHDFTQAGGELTPTMKVKRNVIYERYGPVFDDLYEGESC